MVADDRSEPKLAVANDVKLELVTVKLSVGVVCKVLVDVGGICATALAMVNVGNVTALELAAEGE